MNPADSLADLPTDDGFRLRGRDATRIETFTDASFAFAMTLLVVSLDVPRSHADLVHAMQGIPAFAGSFAILFLFWYGHHNFSRRYGLEDGVTILLSAVLVFVVLVYVYPLKFLFTVFVAWIGWLVWRVRPAVDLGVGPAELSELFVIYGIGFAAMCLSLVLLHVHALRLRDVLQLNAVERHETRAQIEAWGVLAAAGLLSVGVALLPGGGSRFGLPGWAYSTLPIVMPLLARSQNRRRKRLADTAGRGAA